MDARAAPSASIRGNAADSPSRMAYRRDIICRTAAVSCSTTSTVESSTGTPARISSILSCGRASASPPNIPPRFSARMSSTASTGP